MLNETITLFRSGFFKTYNFSETQCTKKGHESYMYDAVITCGMVLNDSGFLLDHNLIHEAIIDYISR